ncbi:MAG: hypothetical protein AAF388_13545 [Bacteroidota bacterium]
MLGFWEILILLLIVGYFVVPFVSKRSKTLKRKPKPKKEPQVIDLDDDHIEIMD